MPTICLDAPCMTGRCLDACCTYTTQRKHALSDWGDVHISPIHLDAPCTFGHPHIFGHYPFVWMSLIPLDAPYIWGASKHTGGSQTWRTSKHTGGPNMWRIQPYRGVSKHRGHPKIKGASKHIGECKHRGCPNIQVGIQHTGGVQTYGGIQTYREPSKHGEFNHMGASKPIMVSKHTGGSQTYWGIQTYRGVQTYREECWGHPNIQGASKCMGHMDTLFVLQSKLSLCCVCTGGISKHMGDIPFFV